MKILLAIVFFVPFLYFTQGYKIQDNANTYKMMFGLGWSAWDNDGNPGGVFSVDQIQAEVFPSRLLVDYYFYKGWSAEASVAFVRYKGTKLVNNQLNVKGLGLSADANLKYSFYNLMGKGLLDPYVIMGMGATVHPSVDSLSKPFYPTFNVGAGVNLWFNNAVGLQLQSAGKIGLTSDFFGKSDYLQHSIGLVVRLESMGGGSDGEFKKEKLKLNTKKKRSKPKGNRGRGGNKKDGDA
jgi:hypothetical protein